MTPPPRRPRRRLDGVLLLDKPVGLSSNDALMVAKRLYAAEKAGHTGTLDPLASGLLPLCFGEATKFSQGLLDADKTYEAGILLGVRTTTGDAEGEVLATRPVQAGAEAIAAALRAFVGDIMQIPPMHSALKKDGKPLYAYARAGQTVERAARPVTIHEITLLATVLPVLTVRVRCSKGTYIRTLAEDIGEALGCGAHLVSLRRTGVGDLDLTGAVTLATLEAADLAERDARLAPVDRLLSGLPRVDLDADAALRFRHGQRLAAHPGADGLVRVYGPDDASVLCGLTLLGVAQRDAGVLKPQRLIQ